MLYTCNTYKGNTEINLHFPLEGNISVIPRSRQKYHVLKKLPIRAQKFVGSAILMIYPVVFVLHLGCIVKLKGIDYYF